MVEQQIRQRGLAGHALLDAFLAVPRHEFVPTGSSQFAYDDHPLDIGCGQTISQPYMVALMTDALRLEGAERVLEIGTGSGYQTAILARLCAAVYTIERLAALSSRAQEVLAKLGFTNVRFRAGDGTLGWPDEAPFDRIIVTAGAPAVPQALQDQLAEGGRLAMPVGDRLGQNLHVLERHGAELRRTHLGGCIFVPLIGRQGWPER